MNVDPLDALFKFAGICFVLQGLFAWLLRRRVENDDVLLHLLFAKAAAEGHGRPVRFLQARYFSPFVAAPVELSESAYPTVVLFWAARLSGFGFFAGMAAFFVAMFVNVGA